MLFRYPFVAMGSGCEILIEGEDSRRAKAMIQSALEQVERLEAKYSAYRDTSLLSRINRDAHVRAVEIDAETGTLLALAGELHGETGGRFDPTIGTLHGLWDFRGMAIPPAQAVAARLEAVGWRHVELAPGSVRLAHPATRLDLGGIVKEYAVDCAVAALEGLGAPRALVNLGGDVRVAGRGQPLERPFRIGVAHPRRHHDCCATLRVNGGAVVTSGDYQRYFIRDGQRYHHLLDPRSGAPLALRFTGVTAHGATALEALRRGKTLFAGDPEAPLPAPGAWAWLVCGADGEPERWEESAACRISPYPRTAAKQAG
jgi:thiamine biosynthesis lipoprotein